MYKHDEKKAYKELYEIFKFLEKNLLEKIPLDIREKIEKDKDNDHSFQINSIDDLENTPILDSTKSLLIIIYKDYLANKEEKEEITKKLNLIQDTIEKVKKEKYNPDNIFKKATPEVILETSLVEYKESLFEKIIKIFKNFFKKQ